MTPDTKRPAQRANAARAIVRVPTTDITTIPAADGIPAQLRRRREASLRLPPLADGLRDPWTAARPPLSVESARAAYFHLEACGLLSELVVDVLARQAALRREVA